MAVRTSSAPVALPAQRDRSGPRPRGAWRHYRRLTPWLFLAPALTFFGVFKFWPSIWGIYLSLFHVRPYLGARRLGLGPLPFLSSPHSSLWTVMLVQIWKHAPYDMVIFIAGLVGIDRQLYESASIDGANAWQRLWAVTLPSLRPITTIVLILGMIRGLRVFTEIYVLTPGGGPGGSTESIVTYIVKNLVVGNDAGYAAAISALLLLSTIVLTGATLWWRRRREDA